MKVALPTLFGSDWTNWARQLVVVLQHTFNEMSPQMETGVIILWDSTIDPPTGGFLECDGTEYPRATYSSLARLYPESTPGNFEVPTLTPPAGALYFIKT